MNKNIGIIGFGNMGSSLAERIKSAYKVYVFDKDTRKTKKSLPDRNSPGYPGLSKML